VLQFAHDKPVRRFALFLLAEDDEDDEFDEETLRDDEPLFLDPEPELLFGNPLTPLYFA
jgi:hypothetical protein